MLCFVIGSSAGDERAALLGRFAEQLGLTTAVAKDFATLRSDPAYVEANRPLVLVADTSPDGALAADTLRFAREEEGHPSLVYVGDTIAPELYKDLVRRHAGEWIRWGSVPEELRDYVRQLSGPDSPERAARILSCLPAQGGVGTTTLALELAVRLARQRRRTGSRVAVLDLDMRGGTLADALDLEPRLDIREIMDRPDRLDEQLIDVFRSRFSPTLDVFASPLGKDVGQVDPQAIFVLLDEIASRYDLVVLDMPRENLAWIDSIAQGSDAVLVCGGSTVPSVKQLGACLQRVDGLGIPSDRLAVAVSHCETNMLGRLSRRADLDRSLPGRRVFFIRDDAARVRAAQNAGRPLGDVAPKCRASRDIDKVAKWVREVTNRPQTAPRHAVAERGAAE